MPRILLLALACSLAVAAAAQPTWRFHLAFEDGTGARDTLWLVYDISATVGSDFDPQVDYALGEGVAQIDHNTFNVFTWNWDGDSTKTHAYPYTEFPNFDGTIIDAINWTPPMTITWDTSLFYASYLPYAQGHLGIAIMDGLAFSQFDHGMGFGVFNMLSENSVTIDFLWDYLFTFSVYFGPVDDTGIHAESAPKGLKVWPNPAQELIQLELSGNEMGKVSVSDLAGRRVMEMEQVPGNGVLDISSLGPGTYVISILTNQIPIYHAKFEKTP